MNKKISVKKTLPINKNAAEVWEVMGNQFADVHLWSTNFKASKAGGNSAFSGIDYSERITVTDRGETIQKLDSFDPIAFKLAYHISKGAPGIAKKASAIWSLEKEKDDKTNVVLEFNMEPKGFLGWLLSPLIKKGMGKSANEIAEDLKYYVENGTPHPRKLKKV